MATRSPCGPLLGRADVVVEDVATALREAGDVILAVQEGYLEAEALIPMVEVVRGLLVLHPGRTAVFKSTGTSWQDLVVAEEITRR